MSAWLVSIPHSLSWGSPNGLCDGAPRGVGVQRRIISRGLSGSEGSHRLPQPLHPSSRLSGPRSAHLWRQGGARGLPAGLLQGQAGWGPGKGLPTSLSSEGIALPPTPRPDASLVPALGSFPFAPCLHPALLTHLPAQTSTSVRRTASSAGPARCASTPVAATSVWTRRALPPTGRAPAPGKGQAGWGWGVVGGGWSARSWAVGHSGSWRARLLLLQEGLVSGQRVNPARIPGRGS